MKNFFLTTFASLNRIKWISLLSVTIFGYFLSMIPIFYLVMINQISPNHNNSIQHAIMRSEFFLILSVISFTSIGTLITRRKIIDDYLALGCGANLIFGIMMMILSIGVDFDQLIKHPSREYFFDMTIICIFISITMFILSNLTINSENGEKKWQLKR